MNYALGYALNLKDLFKTFDFKKLKLSAKECEKLVGNRHKELIAYLVMKYCIKLVLDDIIDNNATFDLPTRKMKSSLKMKKYEGEDFARGRRRGKWEDVDFLASDFSGYQMIMKLQSLGITREKPVYLDSENKDRITQHTNNGKLYF